MSWLKAAYKAVGGAVSSVLAVSVTAHWKDPVLGATVGAVFHLVKHLVERQVAPASVVPNAAPVPVMLPNSNVPDEPSEGG